MTSYRIPGITAKKAVCYWDVANVEPGGRQTLFTGTSDPNDLRRNVPAPYLVNADHEFILCEALIEVLSGAEERFREIVLQIFAGKDLVYQTPVSTPSLGSIAAANERCWVIGPYRVKKQVEVRVELASHGWNPIRGSHKGAVALRVLLRGAELFEGY